MLWIITLITTFSVLFHQTLNNTSIIQVFLGRYLNILVTYTQRFAIGLGQKKAPAVVHVARYPPPNHFEHKVHTYLTH